MSLAIALSDNSNRALILPVPERFHQMARVAVESGGDTGHDPGTPSGICWAV